MEASDFDESSFAGVGAAEEGKDGGVREELFLGRKKYMFAPMGMTPGGGGARALPTEQRGREGAPLPAGEKLEQLDHWKLSPGCLGPGRAAPPHRACLSPVGEGTFSGRQICGCRHSESPGCCHLSGKQGARTWAGDRRVGLRPRRPDPKDPNHRRRPWAVGTCLCPLRLQVKKDQDRRTDGLAQPAFSHPQEGMGAPGG